MHAIDGVRGAGTVVRRSTVSRSIAQFRWAVGDLGPSAHTGQPLILIPGATAAVVLGRQCPDRAQTRRTRRFARTAADCGVDSVGPGAASSLGNCSPTPATPRSRSTIAAELAAARVDRDDLESVLRLIWPSMAELHACFHLSQRRQAARDDAAFNELIARLDEEDDDSDG